MHPGLYLASHSDAVQAGCPWPTHLQILWAFYTVLTEPPERSGLDTLCTSVH